jgi:hypothetical protein
MALGSTQPLTEMSTRCISLGKGGRCVRLTTLSPSCAVVMKSGNLNFLEPLGPLRGPSSAVGIVTAYVLEGSGIVSRWGRDFPQLSRLALRPTQPPINAYWVSFPGLKRSGRGVDHPHPFTAEVKGRVELYIYFTSGLS